MRSNKNLFILIIIILSLIQCQSEISVYKRERQLFYLFDQNKIDKNNFTGFVYILKSFGCSSCEEITYTLLRDMINDLKYKNKEFVLISVNDEILIRNKINCKTDKRVKYLILDDLSISRLGLVYPYDILIEIEQGEIIYHNMISESNKKILRKRYQ